MSHYIFSHPNVLKSCLCFDPSAPVDSRISNIADMNYERYGHSLVVANRKLYAIGGEWAEILHIFIRNICQFRYQEFLYGNVCNSIEEYDPQTNKWREVGKINLQISGDNSFNKSHKILFYCKKLCWKLNKRLEWFVII